MKLVFTDYNVLYLPMPNAVEVFLGEEVAPLDLTKTAFVLPMFEDGSFLLATNQRRGIEIPGGHVEPGETLEIAAAREGLEEIGAIVVDLKPFAYLKMQSDGEVPADWKYPHPLSYQQFYVGRITEVRNFEPNAECAEPYRVYDPNDRRIVRKQVSILIEAARAAMLPKAD